MASPADLSLDCKPHGYSMLPKSFGDQILQPSSDQNQTHKLQDFLARLEEERLKIDAFKRELPLCMQLLTNAVETSRQQLQVHSNQEARLEEFIPLTLSSSEASADKATSLSDKTSWMTSAQLWSHKDETDIGLRCTSPKLALDKKPRNGGAFLPFSKERNLPSTCSPNPDLALNKSADQKDMEEDMKRCSDQTKGTASQTANNSNGSNTSQSQRKARRCWSPDLHRRFVNALQMLGGSQVATPKQIRELMKVDGLTNDEVKSHLQKYRLHTRRASPSRGGGEGHAPQLVVLGGIWVPSPNSLYATPAHYYTATAPPPQMHYNKSTPESESIEDGKSDSAGERKDSEITLNFSN